MNYQKLFEYMSEQHGVTLMISDMQKIRNIVLESMPTDEEIESFVCDRFKQTAYSDEIVAALKEGCIIGAKWVRSRSIKTD